MPWEDVSRITAPENVDGAQLELLGVKDNDEYTELVQGGKLDPDPAPAWGRELVRGRERILCTLIYSYLTHKFPCFCYRRSSSYLDSNDGCLPLSCEIKNGKITVTDFGRHEEIFSEWKPSEIYDFYESQWRFNVPRLRNYNNMMPLTRLKNARLLPMQRDESYHPRTVFPFDSETLPKMTLFSRVWKVKIHTSHVFSSVCKGNEFVALKESVNAESQEARNERSIYSKLAPYLMPSFQNLSISHLTKFRLAFRRQNTEYIIFPWAEGGSLDDFWSDKDPKDFTATELRHWMEQNIIGLLGAVHTLHRIGFSHGDLKPGNILVFSEPKNPENPEQRCYSYEFRWTNNDATSTFLLPRELGILKIADFGTARVNSNATIARTRDANALTGSQRYAPPEFDRNELAHNSPRSRLYDVWSMGCILLEFITWVCYGRGGVQRLSSRLEEPYPGRFWTIGENRQKTLHPYVRHQFRKLKRRLEDTGTDKEWLKWLNKELKEYLLQLLEVVRTQMLVVNLDKEIPAALKQPNDSCTDEEGSSSEGTEASSRASAKILHTQFLKIAESSEEMSVDGEELKYSPTSSAETTQSTEFVQGLEASYRRRHSNQ